MNTYRRNTYCSEQGNYINSFHNITKYIGAVIKSKNKKRPPGLFWRVLSSTFISLAAHLTTVLSNKSEPRGRCPRLGALGNFSLRRAFRV